MKSECYKQCVLENEEGQATTTWLPLKHAKNGVRLTLKGLDGIWAIQGVFQRVLTTEQLNLVEASYRHHREVTDI